LTTDLAKERAETPEDKPMATIIAELPNEKSVGVLEALNLRLAARFPLLAMFLLLLVFAGWPMIVVAICHVLIAWLTTRMPFAVAMAVDAISSKNVSEFKEAVTLVIVYGLFLIVVFPMIRAIFLARATGGINTGVGMSIKKIIDPECVRSVRGCIGKNDDVSSPYQGANVLLDTLRNKGFTLVDTSVRESISTARSLYLLWVCWTILPIFCYALMFGLAVVALGIGVTWSVQLRICTDYNQRMLAISAIEGQKIGALCRGDYRNPVGRMSVVTLLEGLWAEARGVQFRRDWRTGLLKILCSDWVVFLTIQVLPVFLVGWQCVEGVIDFKTCIYLIGLAVQINFAPGWEPVADICRDYRVFIHRFWQMTTGRVLS
jgi:hypothetical protein